MEKIFKKIEDNILFTFFLNQKMYKLIYYYFLYFVKMENIKKNFSDQSGLQYIMKQTIRNIMEVPTKDQIFDNVSFKLGAFYKRFWENKFDGLKQNTRKAGEIVTMAEKVQLSREDDRLVKVCAYARQINKFQSKNYQTWKKCIWIDLTNDERKMMEQYVQELTPPVPYPEEPKEYYLQRSKKHMFSAYAKMQMGMLLVEVFEKIWTIRKYRDDDQLADVKRHQALTKQILAKINSYHLSFDKYLEKNIAKQDWQQIKNLW